MHSIQVWYGSSDSQVVIVQHHYVGIDLLRWFPGLRTLDALLFVIAVLSLLFSLGFGCKVFRQRFSVGTLKGGVIGEAEGVNCNHPTFHKPELLGLKDHKTS